MAVEDEQEDVNASELIENIKGFHKQKGRFVETKGGYVFDRRLIQAFLIFFTLTSALAFFVLGGFTGTYAYASCPADAINGYCENGLYGSSILFGFVPCKEPACLQETLTAGETIGEKPPSLTGFYVFQALLFVCVLIINHLIYNGLTFAD